jgi:hypothetical protein
MAEIAADGPVRPDLVTGASAVSMEGIRFGKGHGFFDLEWGMFTDLGLADERTPVVAVAHDVQVVEETAAPEPHRHSCRHDRDAHAADRDLPPGARPRGVKWELLSPEQIAATPAASGTEGAIRALTAPVRQPRQDREVTRMTLRISRRGAMAAGAAALALGAAPRLARAATPMTMQAAWINDAEFMGYMIGLDEGYYAAEGLDLEYLSGGPDVIPESSIVSGRADLALTTPDTTIKAIVDQGAPFRIIGAQYQKNPIGVVSLEENGILEPKDLIGRTLAAPPVNTISVAGDAEDERHRPRRRADRALRLRPDAAAAGRDRRLLDFTTNVPYTIEQAGGKPTSFLLYDHGFTIYNDTVVVTEETCWPRSATCW